MEGGINHLRSYDLKRRGWIFMKKKCYEDIETLRRGRQFELGTCIVDAEKGNRRKLLKFWIPNTKIVNKSSSNMSLFF